MIRLTILFAFLLALSCNTPKNANTPIEGTQWVLVSYVSIQTGGQAQLAITDREANLFMQDGKVNGSTGCNRYNGGYTMVDGKMEASQLVMTKMFCQNAAVQEKAFMAVMNSKPSVEMADGQLVLSTPKGEKLTFRKGDTSDDSTSDASTSAAEEKKN